MKNKSLAFRASVASACAIVLASLTACGGDDGPDPLQKYREQAVQWTVCDPGMMGADAAPVVDAAIKKYGDRLRCSFVRVPLDWAAPERGDIVVSATRLAAGKPDARRGALLFNPGGPGGDGLFGNTLRLIGAFAESNPGNPQGAKQLRLLDEYDIVGFSPRGTGTSTRLQCATNEISRFVDLSAAGWDTPANIANANYNDKKSAEACLKSPITPYINTDATARDMDLLRGLLGDEKLNYVGYSYGTWLGAWYASLFPERVGRMVLDSSMDFTSRFEEASLAQPPARQRLFDEVLTPYAVRHAGYFHLGASEADVRAIMPGLDPKIQAVLGAELSNVTSSREGSDTFLALISAARGLNTVLKTVDPSHTEAVTEGLSQQVFDPDNEGHDTIVRFWAGYLFQKYRSAWLLPHNQPIDMSPNDSVFWAVQCNDTSATTDLPAWAERVRGILRQAPMFFGDNQRNLCAFWGGPKVSKPDLAPMKPLDVLFVQSQYDAATYTEGAIHFFAQLPKAGLVYVPGEYQHGLYPYEDDCVDPAVTSYLLGEALGQQEISCPAQRLKQDKPVQGKSGSESESNASQVYQDPQKARQLIEAFKKGLIPGGLNGS